MISSSGIPHDSSFTDNVPISKSPDFQNEIDSHHPTNHLQQSSISSKGQVRDNRGYVHLLIQKILRQDLAGKEHIKQYLRHQYIRHCRPNTFRNTYNALVPFVLFLKDVGKDCLEKVKRHDVEAFIEHEQDRGLKVSTVKMRLAVLKAFFSFLMERSVIEQDAFPWKMRIKLPEILPRAMDPEDVGRLLSAKSSARDRAMILLLLRTGMRIGELLSTTMRDVNLREQKILIFEADKNLLGRVVYFSEDAKKALKRWLEVRETGTEFLFYGNRGRALSYGAARMVFVRYLQRAGLSHKDYTPHCLRHTYATDLLNALMPIECLEKLLGHKSLEVTRRYARLSDKTREEQYFKAMDIIERRQSHDPDQLHCELQTILEETQLLPSHSEELHEHP